MSKPTLGFLASPPPSGCEGLLHGASVLVQVDQPRAQVCLGFILDRILGTPTLSISPRRVLHLRTRSQTHWPLEFGNPNLWQTCDIGSEAGQYSETAPQLVIPQILTQINQLDDRASGDLPVLLLDSIDLCLVENSLSHVLRLIADCQRLGRFHQLVAFSTLPSGPTLTSLSRHFPAVIHLGADSDSFSCQTFWRGEGAQRPSFHPGVERFHLNASKDQIIRIERVVPSVNRAPVGPNNSAPDPSDSLDELSTFNLKLSENEKEARARLVLPFWKTGTESGQVESPEPAVRIVPKPDSKAPSSKSTHIYYEPDEVDDWDEEDPDDDLDF